MTQPTFLQTNSVSDHSPENSCLENPLENALLENLPLDHSSAYSLQTRWADSSELTPLMQPTVHSRRIASLKGVFIAATILVLWSVSLGILLTLPWTDLPWMMRVAIAPLAILWQMFLYTGLFITAHDAMHGAVCPSNVRVNHAIGTLALFCYGFFPYKALLQKHWMHHRHPSTEIDPDFHRGDDSFAMWYFQFMKNYWSWKRIGALALFFHGTHYFFHLSTSNLILFWAIPSILSSVQLFYFGTFLTHREPETGYPDHHRAESTHFPVFWSFITCYHFGYHQEHHEYPQVPWWRLPEIYAHSQSSAGVAPLAPDSSPPLSSHAT